MTAYWFYALRKRLNLSQAKLAKKLHVHTMTVSKWERDEVPIPYSVELVMKLFVAAAQIEDDQKAVVKALRDLVKEGK